MGLPSWVLEEQSQAASGGLVCRLGDSSKNLQSSEMGQSQVTVSGNIWRAQDQHQSLGQRYFLVSLR